MQVFEDQIDKLLDLAFVDPERHQQARKRLIRLLAPGPLGKSPARSVYDAGIQRGSAKLHNKKLRSIKQAAIYLQQSLVELRELPHTHNDFWSFGPIAAKHSIEAEQVFDIIANVRSAAELALKKETKRTQYEIKNVVCIAVKFIKDFSRKPSLSPDNQDLVLFLQIFFKVVTGKSFKGSDFRTQIKAARQALGELK